MTHLYGDGIHDDTIAIQEMIDNAGCELTLPSPQAYYLISAPLEIPSNFKLRLPRFAEVRLAKDSNCVMLRNKMVADRKERTLELYGAEIAARSEMLVYDYINEYSPDAPCCNIEVEGGIWNLNNLEQSPNPIWARLKHLKCEPYSYSGFIFLFYNVKNLRISSLTLKDTSTFAMVLDKISYYTVNDITFDFNYGNPFAACMDGIHICGNCHFGEITNLKGACYDDLVAINGDEGSSGPITNLKVSGIYAEDCHSAVRFLSFKSPMERIHISDIYGTFYQDCIGFSKYYLKSPYPGLYDAIPIDHVYASKAKLLPVYNKSANQPPYPLIQVQSGVKVKSLKISDMYRQEHEIPVETIHICEGAEVDSLIMENISTENHTQEKDMPTLVNRGAIKRLEAKSIMENGEAVAL